MIVEMLWKHSDDAVTTMLRMLILMMLMRMLMMLRTLGDTSSGFGLLKSLSSVESCLASTL